MKKIIATVLAMVMALALCTTAFAATVGYTGYDSTGKKYEYSGTDYKFNITFVDGDYDKTNHAMTGADVNSVDHYDVVVANDSSATVAGTYIKADKSDYDLKLTADGKTDLYLSKVDSANYVATATKYTNIGKNCGQLDVGKSGTYYEAVYYVNGEKVTEYYKAEESGSYNLLVDDKLVAVSSTNLFDKKVGHEWKAATYDADDNATTYKCKDCGTVATVYKTKDAAAASGAAVYAQGTDLGLTTSKWLAWTDGSTVTPGTKDDNKGTSPKTFDAGIAMYVGMALTSVAGSAVVIGKKKEF